MNSKSKIPNTALMFVYLMTSVFALVAMSLPAAAQFSYRRTVGDETENKYQPGVSHAVQYRGSIIANPSLLRNNANNGNFTRHTRLGESTGIGGSTLQTTSVTSESRPALVRPFSVSSGTPLITRPNLNIQFGSAAASPALKSFDVEYPGVEGAPIRSLPETFTGQKSLFETGSMFSNSTDHFEFGQ